MPLRPLGVSGSRSHPPRLQPALARSALVPSPRPGPVRTGVRLAVDVGSVRVGVARSDPDGVLASPLEVIAHGRGDLDRLAALTAAEEALEVIVGLPTTLAGRQGQAAVSARQGAAGLADRIAPVPV